MTRVVCHVVHRPGRLTFTWSDGTASFEPYHLTGTERDAFDELARQARQALAESVGAGNVSPELSTIGRQLYRATLRLDATEASSAQDVVRWLTQALGTGTPAVEILGDGAGQVPWNLLHDGTGFWGERFDLGVGRRVNPLRTTPFLVAPSHLVAVDADLHAAMSQAERASLAGSQDLLVAGLPQDLASTLRSGVPDVLIVIAPADRDGLRVGGQRVTPAELRAWVTAAREGNPDPVVCLLGVGGAGQAAAWQHAVAAAAARVNGLVTNDVPLTVSLAHRCATEFIARFVNGRTSVGGALRELRPGVGVAGLAVSAYCPANVRVAESAEAAVPEGFESPPVLALPATPYRPLTPYGPDDRPLFVGREEDTLRLAALLDDASIGGVFLQGGPGVGKTSLLLAGLLPHLEQEAVGFRLLCDRSAGETNVAEAEYPPIVLRATHDLLGQLADALFAFCSQPLAYASPAGDTVTVDLPALLETCITGSSSAGASSTAVTEQPGAVEGGKAELQPRDLWAALRQDPELLSAFLDEVTRRLPYELVIVIDQGEDLITQVRLAAERARRAEALAALARLTQSDARCKVVVSLRTHYYGQLAGLLAEAGGPGRWRDFLLDELGEARLADVVLMPTSAEPAPFADEVPFAKYGFTFEDGVAQDLVEQVIEEARYEQQGVLSVLQATCAFLYEQRVVQQRQRLLRKADLKAVGGVRGVLARYVEHRLNRLPVHPGARTALRNLMTSIYTRHPDGTITADLVPARALKEQWKAAVPIDQAVTTAAEQTNLFAVESLLVGGQQGLYVTLGDDAAAQAAKVWEDDRRRQAYARTRVIDTLWVMIPLVLLAGALTFFVMRWRGAGAAEPDEKQLQEVAATYFQKGTQAVRTPLYRGQIARAAEAVRAGNALQARHALLAQPGVIPASRQDTEMRGLEWGYLWRQVNGERFELEGHRGTITAVAVTPDGKRAASASLDGTARVWDPSRGLVLAAAGEESMQRPLFALALSPDGKTLATAGNDKLVRLWDLSGLKEDFVTLKEARSLVGHEDTVLALAFNKDGLLASAGVDQKVIVWDLKDGKPRHTLKEHGARVHALAFSADGKSLASAGAEAAVLVWDVDGGKKVQTIKTALQAVNALAFAPDGSTLSVGGEERQHGVDVGVVRFLDPAKGAESKAAPLSHGMGVLALTYLDGKTLLTAGKDHVVRRWDVAAGRESGSMVGHLGWVRGVAVARDAGLVLSGGYDRGLKVWDVNQASGGEVLTGHQGPVLALALGDQDCVLASGGADGKVRLWDAGSGKPAGELTAAGPITALAFATHTKAPTLAVASVGKGEEAEIKLYELTASKDKGYAAKELRTLPGHKGPIFALAFQADRPRLASASADRMAILWDADSGKPVHALPHRGEVRALVFSHDGKFLFTGGAERAVRVWSTQSGEPAMQPIIAHTDTITGLGYLEAGNAMMLVSAGQDNLVRVWSFKEGKPELFRESRAAGQAISTLAMRRGFYFTGGWDHSVRSWDFVTGERFTFPGHTGPVRSVAVSADLSLLASAGQDGTVRLWRSLPEAATKEKAPTKVPVLED